jgi:proline dehydrogenase
MALSWACYAPGSVFFWTVSCSYPSIAYVPPSLPFVASPSYSKALAPDTRVLGSVVSAAQSFWSRSPETPPTMRRLTSPALRGAPLDASLAVRCHGQAAVAGRGLPVARGRSPALFSRGVASAAPPPPPRGRRVWPRVFVATAAASPLLVLWYARPPGGALTGIDRDPQRRTIFTDFSDVEKIYESASSVDLFKTLFIYRLCSHSVLIDNSERLVKMFPGISKVVLENTVYGHFIAGRDTEEALKRIAAKFTPVGVSCCLFYSRENANTPSEWDDVESHIRQDMDFAAAAAKRRNKGDKAPIEFLPVKVTALTDDSTLLQLAAWLRFQRRFPDHPATKEALQHIHPVPVAYDLPPSYAKEAGDETGEARPDPLTPEQVKLLDDVVERVVSLAEYARERDLRILIDAEQTFLQPALDYLAIRVMQRTNHKRTDGKHDVVAFNTYQHYLRYTAEKFDSHLTMARDGDWILGAKMVRGAYLESETALARANNLPSPIQRTKMNTDHAYNVAAAKLIEAIPQGIVAGYFGTHNLESITLAAQRQRSLGIPADTPHVTYAQLMGMGMNLTLALTGMGFNVNTLVPYGPVSVVMPYLLRRLQENKDIMAGAQYERQLLYTELQRRAGGLSFLFV